MSELKLSGLKDGMTSVTLSNDTAKVVTEVEVVDEYPSEE